MAASTSRFPFYSFKGSHYEVGRQYGEACAALIHAHRDMALDRLEAQIGVNRELALTKALAFQEPIRYQAPFFADEIRGVADGSGISLGEAYLLQLRAEVGVVPLEALHTEPGDECTSFALQPEATSNGRPILGQNADLPAFYKDISVVVEFCFDDMPSVLMLTPAGQISYIGINSQGLGVAANFITCDGWRLGFPRYLLSRMALTTNTVAAAKNLLGSLERASSRNLVLIDGAGNAADLELTPTQMAAIAPINGMITHANHFISPELRHLDRAKDSYLPNTHTRHQVMEDLLRQHHGEIGLPILQSILRDRSSHPNCISRHKNDDDSSDVMTFASMIAEPTLGKLWVAVGPPHENPYHEYGFSETN